MRPESAHRQLAASPARGVGPRPGNQQGGRPGALEADMGLPEPGVIVPRSKERRLVARNAMPFDFDPFPLAQR